jgi:hypothetical protein
VTKKHLAGIQPRRVNRRPASDTSCAVDGCIQPRVPKRGMCRMHRARIIRDGTPGQPLPYRRLSTAERLLACSTEDGTGCRIWVGTVNNRGYGVSCVRDAGVTVRVYAHRLSYETFVGPIPPGLEVLHSCDRPPCIEPSHLRPGTHQENALDMTQRRRHPLHLPPEAVDEIFARSDRGESIAAISRAMGIPAGTISARRARRKGAQS